MTTTTTLTFYTENYDSNENIVNKGMSNKAFIDMDNQLGIPFKSLDDALEYCMENNINPNFIEINYLTNDGTQMFRKFKLC